MTGHLLDTSILSVFAPGRRDLPPHFEAWAEEQREHGSWYLSTIVIHELERGIAKLRRAGGVSRADALKLWLSDTLLHYEGRILSVDTLVAREAGKLEDSAIAAGRNPGLADVLIAATARIHDLSILTANVRHFAVLDVSFRNPFSQDKR